MVLRTLAPPVRPAAQALGAVAGPAFLAAPLPPRGARLLGQLGLDPAAWCALAPPDRARLLLAGFWAGHRRRPWLDGDAAAMQSLVDDIEGGLAAQDAAAAAAGGGVGPAVAVAPAAGAAADLLAPAGQVFYAAAPARVAVHLTPSLWLARAGLTCGAWASLDYYAKLSAAAGALGAAGQYAGGDAAARLVAQLDAYCPPVAPAPVVLADPYYYGAPLPYVVNSTRWLLPQFWAPRGGWGGGWWGGWRGGWGGWRGGGGGRRGGGDRR